MSRGKYLSLEEARNSDNVAQFAKENPSEGNEELFNKLLESIATKKPKPSRSERKK